jgi:hypothetical protein
MSRTVSQISVLALVVCFVLCQPAAIAASSLSLTSVRSQRKSTGPNLINFNGSTTSLTTTSERPSTEKSKGKFEAVSAEKTTKKSKKSNLRSKAGYTSKKGYVKSTKNVRQLSHHVHPGNQEDCDACHSQCLISGLACIALSILTSCLPCGGVCLVYQAACQATCNRTTACKNVNGGGGGTFEEFPVNP